MNYPMNQKIDTYLKFIVNQLNYDTVTGRLSAIQLLREIIKQFPIVSIF